MQAKFRKENYFWIGIGIFALLLKLFILWYTYWHRHFLVPPGGDVISHYNFIDQIIKTGSLGSSGYPQGFHILIAFICKISNQDIWSVLVNFTPVLIVLPSLAMFFLLRQMFSLKISIIASSLLLLSSNYPLIAFIDSSYPDMLAYGFLGAMLFGFVFRYFRTNKISNLIWSGFFLILIFFIHNFTFANISAILVIFLILQFYIKLYHSQIKKWQKITYGFGVLFLILAIGYILSTVLYNGTLKSFFVSFILNKPLSLSKDYLWDIAPNYIDYPDTNGYLLWFLGLGGFIYVLVNKFPSEKGKVKQLAIIWLLFFYLMSRFPGANVLSRFARELALPLTVFTAFLLEYLIEKSPNSTKIGQILAYGLIGYFVIMNSSLFTGVDKIPFQISNRVFFEEIDQEKINWMAENITASETVLYNPWGNWFFPLRTKNAITPIGLEPNEIEIINQHLKKTNNKSDQEAYNQLVQKEKMKFSNIKFIFDDVPPVNMDPSWYHDYSQNKVILEELEPGYRVIKTFGDGALIYQKND